MLYPTWHKQTMSKIKPVSELRRYVLVLLFSVIVFALCYGYLAYLKIPGLLNKSIADTSVILIGSSMLLSSICYFWDFLDSKIVYRKHLGLVGFAFALVHLGLSFSAFQRLLQLETWQQGAYGPALAGTLALLIFTVMAIISNMYAATKLGGKTWRVILRTGYLALALVFVHVVLLKSARWLTWYQEGIKTLPSVSLIVSVFIVIVIIMRVVLWLSQRKNVQR